MLLWTIFKVALKSLVANKLRSFLAMLGIIIGVAAVIAMLALGAGARQSVMERINSMGTNLLIVRPGMIGARGVHSGTEQNLTLEDALAILNEVPDVRQLAPVVAGMTQLKYFNKNTSTSVYGTPVTYFEIRSFEIAKGRTFTEYEAERMARVAVLGATTAETLFGEESPVGKTVKIKGINFQVVGVLTSKGDQGWFNPDDQALVPYTTAMNQLFGLDYVREIDIQVDEDADSSQVQEQAAAVLRKRHRIRQDAEDDFHIRDQAEILETASQVTQTFTILLGGIAGISLLVGGIGIMNIMLVTVTERTREIGIRKAIGAKSRDILGQFLIESVIMSGLGGVIGVIVGVTIAWLASRLTGFATAVETGSVIMSLSFAAGVGIFFGFYPARCAAKLDPIVALRYE